MNRKHTTNHFRHTTSTVWLIGLWLLGQTVAQGVQPDHPAASKAMIAQLVSDLGDPSYQTRSNATLALCEIGAPATHALHHAASGDDMEIAFRAKHVLDLLDHIYFAGVEIELSLSKTSVSWSKPVDLLVTLRNQSPYPARIPFETLDDESQLATDAQQVGRLLDLADWLTVVSAKGTQISLHLDDYMGHPDITKAVNHRIEDRPSSMLLPHQTLIVRIPSINRGWARYRLFEQGSYTFMLAYLPAWNDKQLLAHNVGSAKSNEATLFVRNSAPPVISRRGPDATVDVRIAETQNDQAIITAHIINHYDRVMLVNANLSPAGPPFSRGEWVVEAGGRTIRLPAFNTQRKGRSGNAGDIFPSNVIAVKPGESVEISAISHIELERAITEASDVNLKNTAKLRFVYTNLWSQHWIKQMLTAEPFDSPQSRQWSAFLTAPRIIFGRLDSKAIDLPARK